MPDVFRKQKRAQDPPELELQVVVHATWETCTFKPPISILSKELKVKTYLPMLKAAWLTVDKSRKQPRHREVDKQTVIYSLTHPETAEILIDATKGIELDYTK